MTNIEVRQASLEVNALYMMSLAMDIIIRDCEWRMAKNREGWKREKKQLFTRFTRAVRDACVLQDQLTQDIWDIEDMHDYKNVDIWLQQANELARLVLLFADRSVDQDSVDRIMKYLREQPGEGIVDEKFLEAFYLK